MSTIAASPQDAAALPQASTARGAPRRPAARAPAAAVPAARRDTRAWQLQSWTSFGLAAGACGVGLAWLPGQPIEQAFMVMGYVFSLAMVFALSKQVRDRQAGRVDAPLWGAVVAGGFAAAVGLTGWGLLRMDVAPAYQAYLGVSWLFLVSAGFTLAKTLRDRHEADLEDAAARDAAARDAVAGEEGAR